MGPGRPLAEALASWVSAATANAVIDSATTGIPKHRRRRRRAKVGRRSELAHLSVTYTGALSRPGLSPDR